KRGNMKDTSSATFNQDVINSQKPILLDVWAPWCGPCRGMEPILEQLSSETKDWAEIVKLNADDNMELVQQLGVSGLPTYLVFKDGQVTASGVGATSKANLLGMLEQARV